VIHCLLLILLLVCSPGLSAASSSSALTRTAEPTTAVPAGIALAEVIQSMSSVLDPVASYTARMRVDISMPGMNVKGKKLQLQFLAPDSFSFKTKGFAILPRRAMTFDPQSLFSGLSEPGMEWPDDSLGADNLMIKGLFKEDGIIVSMEFRIDTLRWVLTDMVATREEEVVMRLKNEFRREQGIWLPASSEILMSLSSDLQKFYERLKQPLRRKRKMHNGEGHIVIGYDDYELILK
jgi:hypothetical protein